MTRFLQNLIKVRQQQEEQQQQQEQQSHSKERFRNTCSRSKTSWIFNSSTPTLIL